MMKFKEGSAVEVLRGADQSSGSWFPAKVIYVDGHKCTVRFELFRTVEGKPVVEKVHKEDVRPCPPPVDNEERWVHGDMVEVLDLHSWRVGKVAKVLGNNRFVVRLLGSIQIKEFHISSLRVQQAWHNDQWVVIGKAGGNKKITNNHAKPGSRYYQNWHSGAQCVLEEACNKEVYGHSSFDKLSNASAPNRNISSHFHSSPDNVTLSGSKRKATFEAGAYQLATGTLPKQVDVISCPKRTVGKKNIHPSIKDRGIGYSELEVKSENENMQVQPFSMPLQVIEENNECSVASCSGNNFPEYTVHHSQKSSRDIVGSSFDDAESPCPSESGEKYSHAKDDYAANVHKLELHAYKSTVQALYASGPLSWEQESLLTNLRLSLHISNEEHLLQLRHLLSAQVL